MDANAAATVSLVCSVAIARGAITARIRPGAENAHTPAIRKIAGTVIIAPTALRAKTAAVVPT
jgi:hypothetical protein